MGEKIELNDGYETKIISTSIIRSNGKIKYPKQEQRTLRNRKTANAGRESSEREENLI